MAYDIFTGLALNQSIDSAAWDSADVSWGGLTSLAGNGANAVKVYNLPGGRVITANWLTLSSHVGQAVFFTPGTGRSGTAHSATLIIHADGSTASQYGLGGIKAGVGAYGTLEVKDLATSTATEIAAAIVDGSQYCLEVYRTTNANGKEYVAKLYNASNNVRGSLIATTPALTLATARPNTALMSQMYDTAAPNIVFSRFESVDAPAADTTAPTLTAPTGAAATSTTATGAVTTNESGGTLFYLGSTSSTATVAAVKAALSKAVTATGAQSVSVSGLSASTAYYLHYVHTDASANNSTVASSASFTTPAGGDTTAPILAAATATATGSTTASGSVATDEGGGTLYRLASTSVTATGAAVKAAALTSTVSATGSQAVLFTGLTASTTYYPHYLQTDAAGNDSLVASGASFTTTAVTSGTLTTRAQTNNTGTVMASETGVEVFIWDATTGALVLKKTGVTLSASGVATVTDAALISGTSYVYDVKLTGSRRRLNPKAAT